MKLAPAALRTALAAGAQFRPADLYSFTLLDGTVARYASTQGSVIVPQGGTAGLLYIGNDILISGAQFKQSIGTSVDEQTLTIAYRPDSRIGGQRWPIALRQGIFNGCKIQRDRAFLQSDGAPIAAARVPLFHGRISTLTAVGRVEAKITVKSDLNLLNVKMPRNYWQASCLHTLFDSGCGLAKGSNSIQGSVGVASLPWAILWPGATTGLYNQGTIRFESGANTGISRTILYSDGTTLGLSTPLDYPVAAGDLFSASYGCDKTMETCAGRFGNLSNFRGFPYVPPPETAA